MYIVHESNQNNLKKDLFGKLFDIWRTLQKETYLSGGDTFPVYKISSTQFRMYLTIYYPYFNRLNWRKVCVFHTISVMKKGKREKERNAVRN
jgi:cellulose synthase/poly-beta-1,6-N-acetylglucosamine synthase-like glycosyltransferase